MINLYIIICCWSIKTIDIDIEDCVIGSVRVGNQIDVSKKFKDSISDLIGENNTFVWVNIKSDSLYNAFTSGKKLLIASAEFCSFMIMICMQIGLEL